jgi:hypothetical protein
MSHQDISDKPGKVMERMYDGLAVLKVLEAAEYSCENEVDHSNVARSITVAREIADTMVCDLDELSLAIGDDEPDEPQAEGG